MGYNEAIGGDDLSLLSEMIVEENRRNLLLQQEYEAKIKKLPKGKMIIKKIGNHEYHYLKYRDGKKTVTDYIGRDKTKIEEVMDLIKKRKHFEQMLLELKEETKLIKKVTGGSI